LTWEQARNEWMKKHREKYEKFVLDTLAFPEE
jgi:hypothetical protein